MKKSLAAAHLSIDDENKGSCSSENHLVVKRRVKEVHLTRKVPNLEVDKGAAGNVVLVDLVGALQEQGFIGGHFVEHDLKPKTFKSQNEKKNMNF